MSKANDASPARGGLSEKLDAISLALVQARKTATPLAAFPGTVPDTLGDAYAIQSASIARWPDIVAGWKVGGVPPELRERYGADRIAGPVYRANVREVSVDSTTSMPVYVGGFAAVEAEFVFRMAKTIEPSDRIWSDEALGEMIASLHVGAEIASSPLADINQLGPTVPVCDFGNNAGLLVGPEIPNWQSARNEDLLSRAIVDGEVVGEASAASLQGGPIESLRFLVSLLGSRGIEMPAGTLITTGATTGIHDVNVTSTSRVEFEGFGGFDVTFEPRSGGQ